MPTTFRALLGALLLACGCHKPTPAVPAPVRGVVTYQGRPLSGGLVVFTPTRGLKPYAARLDAEGHYELEPRPPAAEGLPPGVSLGVPPGVYQVTFAGASGMPGELRRPDTSGVAREVLAGRENVIDFHITASGG